MNGQLAPTGQASTQVALDHQHNVAQHSRQASALKSIAQRLQISEKQLVATLKATVFSACRNDDEFAALIVVSNEYRLNPLLKEIYAFPQKGGGIVPMVSIDGWLKLMNGHPEFDGIEYDYIADAQGKLMAVEAIIWRKDRSRPIKVTEYLEECKRETDPWRKSPSRMLRHRATIQCARVAFGFSGIGDADEEPTIYLGGDLEPQDMRRANIMPSNDQLLEQKRETIDQDTGEILDEEELARQLDAQATHGDDWREGRADEQMGEEHSDAELPRWAADVKRITDALYTAQSAADIKAAAADLDKVRVTLPEAEAARIDGLIASAREQMKAKA
jgi:phage recombination protein Bet